MRNEMLPRTADTRLAATNQETLLGRALLARKQACEPGEYVTAAAVIERLEHMLRQARESRSGETSRPSE